MMTHQRRSHRSLNGGHTTAINGGHTAAINGGVHLRRAQVRCSSRSHVRVHQSRGRAQPRRLALQADEVALEQENEREDVHLSSTRVVGVKRVYETQLGPIDLIGAN